LRCQVCSRTFHSSCVGLEHSRENEWTCSNCDHIDLLRSLEYQLKEIESNSWRTTFIDDRSDTSDDEDHQENKELFLNEPNVVKKIVPDLELNGIINFHFFDPSLVSMNNMKYSNRKIVGVNDLRFYLN
jgi:hypothetical protein